MPLAGSGHVPHTPAKTLAHGPTGGFSSRCAAARISMVFETAVAVIPAPPGLLHHHHHHHIRHSAVQVQGAMTTDSPSTRPFAADSTKVGGR